MSLATNLQPTPFEPPHGFRTLVCTNCGHQIQVPIHCHSRTCIYCAKARAFRVERRLRWALSLLPRSTEYFWKHITLTIPNVDNLEAGIKHLTKSFRKLRATKLWRDSQIYGFYVIEIQKTGEKWHPHLHIISYGSYIPWQPLFPLWLRCSRSGRHVYLRVIKHGTAISSYIAKYLSKTPVIDADAEQELNDLSLHIRMFSPFGKIVNLLKNKPLPKFKRSCPRCGSDAWVPDFMLDMLEKYALGR